MEKKKYDAVHKPSHYTEGRKFEPKDVIRDWGLNFNLGSAIKYVARAGRKDDIVQDLKKAQEFIQFEIDAIEAERAKATKPKASIHPNCMCATEPFFNFDAIVTPPAIKKGMIELEVPKGASTEDVIQMAIKKILGGE